MTKAQLTWLRKFHIPDSIIANMTKSEASGIIDKKFNERRKAESDQAVVA